MPIQERLLNWLKAEDYSKLDQETEEKTQAALVKAQAANTALETRLENGKINQTISEYHEEKLRHFDDFFQELKNRNGERLDAHRFKWPQFQD